jgi:hypothetical protein
MNGPASKGGSWRGALELKRHEGGQEAASELKNPQAGKWFPAFSENMAGMIAVLLLIPIAMGGLVFPG